MTLDEVLRQASEAADRSTEHAVPGQPPSPAGRPSMRWAAGALILIVATGFVLRLRTDDGPVVATGAEVASATDPSTDSDDAGVPGAAEVVAGGVARYVSDAPPEDLTLDYAGLAVELGVPTGTEVRWIYGYPDRLPGVGERAVTVSALRGAQRPVGLLEGTSVDINGVEGSVLLDGSVMFEMADAMVTVFGDPLQEDLVAVARAIGSSVDGQPVMPTTTPGGYSLLGSFDRTFYGEGGSAMSVDAELASYRQGYARYIDVISMPRTPVDEHMYRWLLPADAETLTVGGRTFFYLYSHEEFGAPAAYVVWFDDDVIGNVVSYGIERDEIDRALSALRIDGDAPTRSVPDEAELASDEPPAPTPPPSASSAPEQVVPTVVLDGMVIVTAVDHSLLGAPDWSAEQYLYGPSGLDVPGPGDPLLLLSVARGSEGLLIGEPITIGGHDGVIIDNARAGTDADVELRVGETNVQLTAIANVELDEVIDAAEQYAIWVSGTGGFSVGSPAQIGVDRTLQGSETIGAWYAHDVNGSLGANTVVYAEPGTTSESGGRRLSVSTNSTSSRSVDWLAWLHSATATTIDLGEGKEAVLARPTEEVIVLRFEHAGRLVEITGTGMTEADVLAAAATFEQVAPGD